VNAWVGNVLALVIGAVVGGALTGIMGLKAASDTFRREQEDRRQHEEAQRQEQARRVRMLLRLENQHNIENLKAFWHTVNFVPPLQGTTDDMELEKGRRIAYTPLPNWGHLMWQSLSSLLPGALTEDEIQQMYTLHSQLDQFSAFRADLQQELSSEIAQKMLTTYTPRLLQVGTNPGTNKQDPEHDKAVALATWVRDFNSRTFTAKNECLRIYNEASPTLSLLKRDMSSQQPHSLPTTQRRPWDWLLRLPKRLTTRRP
jgi:hypothetical protein